MQARIDAIAMVALYPALPTNLSVAAMLFSVAFGECVGEVLAFGFLGEVSGVGNEVETRDDGIGTATSIVTKARAGDDAPNEKMFV